MPTIYSGDTWPFTATLKVGVVIFPVAGATPGPADTVTAKFIDSKTSVPITNDITCLEATPGADWLNGKVAIAPSDVESIKLEPFVGKPVLLVIQVQRTGYGKKEWQTSYTIKKGWIA
jgi:hypothetical protein